MGVSRAVKGRGKSETRKDREGGTVEIGCLKKVIGETKEEIILETGKELAISNIDQESMEGGKDQDRMKNNQLPKNLNQPWPS